MGALHNIQEAVARHANKLMTGNGIQFAELISTPIINRLVLL